MLPPLCLESRTARPMPLRMLAIPQPCGSSSLFTINHLFSFIITKYAVSKFMVLRGYLPFCFSRGCHVTSLATGFTTAVFGALLIQCSQVTRYNLHFCAFILSAVSKARSAYSVQTHCPPKGHREHLSHRCMNHPVQHTQPVTSEDCNEQSWQQQECFTAVCSIFTANTLWSLEFLMHNNLLHFSFSVYIAKNSTLYFMHSVTFPYTAHN